MRIDGVADLRNSRIDAELNLESAKITGPVLLDEASAARIELAGAQIGDELSLRDVHIGGPGGGRLCADGVLVAAAVRADGLSAVRSEVRLVGADIGGGVSMRRARLHNPDGCALRAERCRIDLDLDCGSGFAATGTVNIGGARVGGTVTFTDAVLHGSAAEALQAEGLRAHKLNLDVHDAHGGVDLTEVQVGTLTLPAAPVAARLNGLRYIDLDTALPARARLDWLHRDPGGYQPQPYEQLIAYYVHIGHDRDARLVRLGKRRAQRRSMPSTLQRSKQFRQLRTFGWRLPGWIYDGLAGYGYVPGRALTWLACCLAAGWSVFRHHPPTGPTGDIDVDTALYTADLILPTSPLGLESGYHPTGMAYLLSVFLLAAGWVLSIALLSPLTRAVSRSDK